MGEVWLAEQTEPRRKVALRLINSSMDTKQVVARFDSVRQALAVMDHPAIAKVFDGGSTLEGRPYFVMEYVAGVPNTEHCDGHKLSTTARPELFTEVFAGVQWLLSRANPRDRSNHQRDPSRDSTIYGLPRHGSLPCSTPGPQG